jgi:hypothetical protein
VRVAPADHTQQLFGCRPMGEDGNLSGLRRACLIHAWEKNAHRRRGWSTSSTRCGCGPPATKFGTTARDSKQNNINVYP